MPTRETITACRRRAATRTSFILHR
jgi:hypothetical protein